MSQTQMSAAQMQQMQLFSFKAAADRTIFSKKNSKEREALKMQAPDAIDGQNNFGGKAGMVGAALVVGRVIGAAIFFAKVGGV